jgi:hypothetical protein
MAKVTFGDHTAHMVPRAEKERVRRFYLENHGCKLMRVRQDAGDIRMGDNFHLGILYGDVTDESEFLRSVRAI